MKYAIYQISLTGPDDDFGEAHLIDYTEAENVQGAIDIYFADREPDLVHVTEDEVAEINVVLDIYIVQPFHLPTPTDFA